MSYTNQEMDKMLSALDSVLVRRDVIGYAAARNSRILREELTEYHNVRDELVMKYGEMDLDEGGNPTGKVSITDASPNFPQFVDEIERFAAISHEPKVFKIKYEEVIGKLSGSEILDIDWMLEE